MSDEKRLIKTLEAQITESDSGQFEVGEQRERNHRFYSIQKMGNEVRGRSHYISPDVLDSVESKKALFKETFLTGRQAVRFKNEGNQIPFEGDAKTAYAELMLNRNNKDRLFRDGWHDAFVAKRQTWLITWEKETKQVELDVTGASQQQVLMGLVQRVRNGDIDSMETVDSTGATVMPNGLMQGSITVDVDDSYVKVELLQPERYFRDPYAAYPDEATFCSYQEDAERGWLKSRGYDPEQVDKLKTDYRFRSDEEDSSRKAHDRSWTRKRQHNRVDEQQLITLYRTWTWLDLWEHAPEEAEAIGAPEGYELYEIHWCAGEILYWEDGTPAIKSAEEMPFFEWCEYKISHAEHGMADADIVAHSQKSSSAIKRGIMDNMNITNNPRYEAVRTLLENPRDLLDNEIGAAVFTTQLGAVKALEQPQLSPLTGMALQMLDSDNDKRSGMSSLAKGMNGDAVRYQNAENTIDKLTAAGNRRVMAAARDWAQTFLVPVCQYIVHLGMREDTKTHFAEVGGRNIPVKPSTWKDEGLSMAVATALTPEEGMRMAQMLLGMHSVKSQDEDLKMLYGVEQKHALFDDIYDSLGIEDSTRYMMRPDGPQYQQAMQQRAQQQQQMMQQQQAMQDRQYRLLESDNQRRWQELNMNATDKIQDNMRADDELEWQKYVEQRELEIKASA